MNARSAKNKGLRFENYLRDVFRDQLDCKAHKTSASGVGLDKNDIILPNYNLEIEAKNQNRYHLDVWWRQLKAQKTSGNDSVLAMRNPKKPEFEETIIAMDLDLFIELVKGRDNPPAIIEIPREFQWDVKNLENSCKKVYKIVRKMNEG